MIAIRSRVRANAYDLAMNGVELGGGSIRIHDSELQNKMFELLGFTPEQAAEQFGFLMNAFRFTTASWRSCFRIGSCSLYVGRSGFYT